MGPSKLFSRALQVILQYFRIPALKSTPGHVREPGRSHCVTQGLTLPGLPGLRLKCQIAKASGIPPTIPTAARYHTQGLVYGDVAPVVPDAAPLSAGCQVLCQPTTLEHRSFSWRGAS